MELAVLFLIEPVWTHRPSIGEPIRIGPDCLEWDWRRVCISNPITHKAAICLSVTVGLYFLAFMCFMARVVLQLRERPITHTRTARVLLQLQVARPSPLPR